MTRRVILGGHDVRVTAREFDLLSYLLAHPGIATRMGQAARRRTQTEFSWERHVDAYDTLYRKLTAKDVFRQDRNGLISEA